MLRFVRRKFSRRPVPAAAPAKLPSGATRIVLHLGLHKTATTSLQEFLHLERDALLANGAFVVPLRQFREEISPLIRGHSDKSRKLLERLLSRSPVPTLIWSDENIMGLTSDIRSGTLYPYADSRVSRLCADLPDCQFEIVIVLRSPVAYLLSSYSEFLRHNGFLEFKDYIANFDVDNFSYLNAFSWLWDLSENVTITVLPFETELGGGLPNIARTMLAKALGQRGKAISLERLPKTRSRSSFTAEEIALGLQIAEQAGPMAAKQFLRMLDFKEHRFGQTKFAPLSDELAQRLDARYREELTVFTERARRPSVRV